jgi:hypothetical protein
MKKLKRLWKTIIIRKQTAIWTTREGIKIRLCDMKDSHLLYALRQVERRLEKGFYHAKNQMWQAFGMLQGEIAMLSAEQAIEEMEELEPLQWAEENHPFYEKMLKEVERRGLTKLDIQYDNQPEKTKKGVQQSSERWSGKLHI